MSRVRKENSRRPGAKNSSEGDGPKEPSLKDQLLVLMMRQRLIGLPLGEVTEVNRWVCYMDLASSIADQVIIGELGAVPSAIVKEAIREFRIRDYFINLTDDQFDRWFEEAV